MTQKTVIRATPENADVMRGLIADWPELKTVVNGLRRQDMFPGLRSMRITLEETEAVNPVPVAGHIGSEDA